MRPIGSTETSVTNYKSMLRIFLEERGSQAFYTCISLLIYLNYLGVREHGAEANIRPKGQQIKKRRAR